jgi:hypothetical protein
MPSHSKRAAKRELILNHSKRLSRAQSPKQILSENVGRSSAADRPRRKMTKGEKG